MNKKVRKWFLIMLFTFIIDFSYAEYPTETDYVERGVLLQESTNDDC